MFGNKPKIEIVEPMASDVNAIVELSFDEEACSFESRSELNEFIAELKRISKQAFKPLINNL